MTLLFPLSRRIQPSCRPKPDRIGHQGQTTPFECFSAISKRTSDRQRLLPFYLSAFLKCYRTIMGIPSTAAYCPAEECTLAGFFFEPSSPEPPETIVIDVHWRVSLILKNIFIRCDSRYEDFYWAKFPRDEEKKDPPENPYDFLEKIRAMGDPFAPNKPEHIETAFNFFSGKGGSLLCDYAKEDLIEITGFPKEKKWEALPEYKRDYLLILSLLHAAATKNPFSKLAPDFRPLLKRTRPNETDFKIAYYAYIFEVIASIHDIWLKRSIAHFEKGSSAKKPARRIKGAQVKKPRPD